MEEPEGMIESLEFQDPDQRLHSDVSQLAKSERADEPIEDMVEIVDITVDIIVDEIVDM